MADFRKKGKGTFGKLKKIKRKNPLSNHGRNYNRNFDFIQIFSIIFYRTDHSRTLDQRFQAIVPFISDYSINFIKMFVHL